MGDNSAGAFHCASIVALVLPADWRLEQLYLRAWFS
jgi:hypothetical protein